MKILIIILLFLSNDIFSDYSEHPEAKEVIESLVRDHGFEKSYVIQILGSARKQEKILQSMSSADEFTADISNGKSMLPKNHSFHPILPPILK